MSRADYALGGVIVWVCVSGFVCYC